jgi:hypothetical protein
MELRRGSGCERHVQAAKKAAPQEEVPFARKAAPRKPSKLARSAKKK